MNPLNITASIISVLQLTGKLMSYLSDVNNAPVCAEFGCFYVSIRWEAPLDSEPPYEKQRNATQTHDPGTSSPKESLVE
jgi:hypothetical protein